MGFERKNGLKALERSMASTAPKFSLLAIALAIAAGPKAACGFKAEPEEALGEASGRPAASGERCGSLRSGVARSYITVVNPHSSHRRYVASTFFLWFVGENYVRDTRTRPLV